MAMHKKRKARVALALTFAKTAASALGASALMSAQAGDWVAAGVVGTLALGAAALAVFLVGMK